MWANVRRGEKLYISPYKNKADYQFDTALPYELPVFNETATQLFQSVPEGIERFETRLKRFIDGLTRNNPGRLDIDWARLRARYRPHAVYRLTQRIDDATHERFANRYRRNATRAAYHIALADQMRIAQQRTTDVVFFEVEHQSVHVVRKRQQLTFHGIFQAINASRTVATRDNRPRFRHFDFAIEILNLLADYLTDFFYIDSHPSFPW